MSNYFGRVRSEILPHLPARLERMLDIGCGEGVTSAFIREHRPDLSWTGGVELVPDAAAKAGQVLDQVWCGDLERLGFDREIPPGSIDAILCLDVLEHLVDPWAMVRRLSPLLSPQGHLVISVPNVRNWKFIRDLLFRGRFHYAEAGLLDRTHLRFFVRETARELAEVGGLKVATLENAHPWKANEARRVLSTVTAGALDDLMIKQFVLVAKVAA